MMEFMKVKHVTSVKDELKEKLCIDNFEKICRTCLSETIDLRSCFDVISDNMCAANLIEDYTTLLVASNDYLPQNICNVCITALLNFHTFKLNCINNEKILSIKKSEINKLDVNSLMLQENNTLDDDDEIVNSANDIYVEELSHNSEFSQIDMESKSVVSNNIKCIDKKLNRKANLQSQIEKAVEFKCKKCDEEFDSSELCKSHIAKHHKQKKDKECPVCKKILISGNVKDHMRIHTKEKPFICEICSEGFSVKGNLTRHMLTHTGEKPHVCENCGKGFIQAAGLASHLLTHSITKNASQFLGPTYICDICERTFKTLVRYDAHLKRHESGKMHRTQKERWEENIGEYSCDQCQRSFKTKNVLKTHQLIHGERTFLCSDCGKRFVTKSQLKSHIKLHTGEKPHTCTVCNKSFAQLDYYEKHMFTHSGYKPYNCDICQKSYRGVSHLKYHMRAHTGERPYKCKVCGKTFVLNSDLTIHKRIHTGERPYSCPVCDKRFYSSSSMKKHHKSHGEIHENLLEQTNPES